MLMFTEMRTGEEDGAYISTTKKLPEDTDLF